MSGQYLGQKHCEIIHGPSERKIETDAPKDNNGLGQSFSPTDLVGAALGSCMMTVMAIWAEQNQIQLKGSSYNVIKHMHSSPRRIAKLEVEVHLPVALNQQVRETLEKIAHSCPVRLSLAADIEVPIIFQYDVGSL